MSDAIDQAQEQLNETSASVHLAYEQQLAELDRDRDELVGEVNAEVVRFQELVEPLLAQLRNRARAFNAEIEARFSGRFADLGERTSAVIQALTDSLDDESPDPAEFNWPEPEVADFDDPLFDF